MATDFEERFKDVMNYVKLRLDGKGMTRKIKTQEDLRMVLENLDKLRKGGDPRMSDDFIDGLVNTRAAQKILGATIGRFTGSKAREEQRHFVFSYTVDGKSHSGAVQRTYQQHGRLQSRFADKNTGRFIKRSLVRTTYERSSSTTTRS